MPAAGSRVLLVCAVGAEAIRRSGGTGRHCAKPGCRTRGGDSVGRSPVCHRSAVFRFDSSASIGYLPLAPVKVECVSLTGGQVGGHLDAGTSEFVSQVPVVQYRHPSICRTGL